MAKWSEQKVNKFFNTLQVSSEPKEDMYKYTNYYKCACCDEKWADLWSCMCDDRCPVCDTTTSPYFSEDNRKDQIMITDYDSEEELDVIAEYDHWNGKGHIEFFVLQNVPETLEIEYLDYSGCAGGLKETLGIEYAITDIWCLQNTMKLREGVTYTLHGLTVHWTRGDGWLTDDDVDYEFESITTHATLFGYLSHKIKMIWWRQVECRLKNWSK